MINLKINGQILKDIELIIFDKDGTLFELHSYWSIIANKRAELICKNMGITFNDEIRDFIAYIMGVDNKNKCMRPDSMIGIKKRSEIEYAILEQLTDNGYQVTIHQIQDAFIETDTFLTKNFLCNYDNIDQIITPIKGVIPFLIHIENKCKCAVLSYDRTNNIHKCLKSTGIDKYFSEVLGGDLLHRPKPDPEGANLIMDHLSIPPSNTIFIGDTLSDIGCGVNANCAYTITRKSELSQAEEIKLLSSLIINDFTEIEVIS